MSELFPEQEWILKRISAGTANAPRCFLCGNVDWLVNEKYQVLCRSCGLTFQLVREGEQNGDQG